MSDDQRVGTFPSDPVYGMNIGCTGLGIRVRGTAEQIARAKSAIGDVDWNPQIVTTDEPGGFSFLVPSTGLTVSSASQEKVNEFAAAFSQLTVEDLADDPAQGVGRPSITMEGGNNG